MRGLIGFTRQLRLYDTKGSGNLTLAEFKQAFYDYEIEMIDIDVENLFRSFCENEAESLNINEFLETFVQPMNKFRYNLVKKVFKFLDYDNQGQMDINYLMDTYDASRHPEVANFKKEREEIEYEFRDSFALNHGMYHNPR